LIRLKAREAGSEEPVGRRTQRRMIGSSPAQAALSGIFPPARKEDPMRITWTIVPAALAATLCVRPAVAQGTAALFDALQAGVHDPLVDLMPMLPLLVLGALAVGGLLRPNAGRWVASFVTAAFVGFFVWWTVAALLVALAAAFATWFFALVGTLLWHPLAGHDRG
jgi:hypothetical protein